MLAILAGCLTFCQIARGEIIEYEKYPPEAAQQNLLVTGKVQDKNLYETRATIQFANKSVSRLRLQDVGTAPIYFQHNGYIIEGSDTITDNVISFSELASLSKTGAYVTKTFLGLGEWTKQYNVETLFTANIDKTTGLHDCPFYLEYNVDNEIQTIETFFSYTNTFHVLPAFLLKEDVVLQAKKAQLSVDTSLQQYYSEGDTTITLSMHALNLQHWQNASMLKIGLEPHPVDILQNFCTVAFLILTLCALIGVSIETTKGLVSFKTAKTCYDFQTIETTMIADFAAGGVAIALLKVMSSDHLLDSRVYGIANSLPQLTSTAVYIFSACTVIVVTLTSLSRFKSSAKQSATGHQTPSNVAAWVLTRGLSECAILMGITCAVPTEIGVEYAFVTIFASSVIIPAVLGRDVNYVLTLTSDWSFIERKTAKGSSPAYLLNATIGFFGVASLLSALVIASNSFLRIVLARSESLPTSNNYHLEFLSFAFVSIIAGTSAALGPVIKTTSEKAKTVNTEMHVL